MPTSSTDGRAPEKRAGDERAGPAGRISLPINKFQVHFLQGLLYLIPGSGR
ncbi:hypothetical protein Pd630_LPD09122 (plasmid) [Rhodococcus opacus PD630]|nr:hypothetical protein Pd630_LPD09122 [Rhodococcus opacus PD630]